MAKSGPIIVLEDDSDDRDILQMVLKELEIENELTWFTAADDAFRYLQTTSQQPFIILCDVNLPGKNGIVFKRTIDEDPELRRKSIPFVFYSTSADQQAVTEAYTTLTVQGFFKKQGNYDDIKKDVKLIMDYWRECKHPNAY